MNIMLQTQILLDYSPVQLMKAVKNAVEIEGMKIANVSGLNLPRIINYIFIMMNISSIYL